MRLRVPCRLNKPTVAYNDADGLNSAPSLAPKFRQEISLSIRLWSAGNVMALPIFWATRLLKYHTLRRALTEIHKQNQSSGGGGTWGGGS